MEQVRQEADRQSRVSGNPVSPKFLRIKGFPRGTLGLNGRYVRLNLKKKKYAHLTGSYSCVFKKKWRKTKTSRSYLYDVYLVHCGGRWILQDELVLDNDKGYAWTDHEPETPNLSLLESSVGWTTADGGRLSSLVSVKKKKRGWAKKLYD